MNLSCPKCNSEDTQKISIAINKGSLEGVGKAWIYNFMIPVITIVLAFFMGLIFGFAINTLVGLLVFIGLICAGFIFRKRVKTKLQSPFAKLSAQMKQDGFHCNRCSHMFIPSVL